LKRDREGREIREREKGRGVSWKGVSDDELFFGLLSSLFFFAPLDDSHPVISLLARLILYRRCIG